MSNDLHKRIRELQQKVYDLTEETQFYQKQSEKWTMYCAYVAGTSIGIIAFLQFFTEPEIVTSECPDVPEVVEQLEIKEVPSAPVKQTVDVEPEEAEPEEVTTPSAPNIVEPKPEPEVIVEKEQDTLSFPMTYIIQSGDSFGKIAERYYKRASLGGWLANQNEVDPTKMRIGQEITLPPPPK